LQDLDFFVITFSLSLT